MKFFGAKILLRAHFEDEGVGTKSTGFQMESVRIIFEPFEEDARREALRLAKKAEHSYVNVNGRKIAWVTSEVHLYDPLDETIISGVEIYSEIIGGSEDCNQSGSVSIENKASSSTSLNQE